jgi:hypothetical protein
LRELSRLGLKIQRGSFPSEADVFVFHSDDPAIRKEFDRPTISSSRQKCVGFIIAHHFERAAIKMAIVDSAFVFHAVIYTMLAAMQSTFFGFIFVSRKPAV